MQHRDGRRWLVAAAVLGLVHAGLSWYWALGGQALLATVGEWAVRWSRQRPGLTFAALGSIGAIKALAALAPTPAARAWRPALARLRPLWWLVAGGLILYGAANTVAPWAVLGGLIVPDGGYDATAMRGHAFVWDPLFWAWGTCLAVGLRRDRQPVCCASGSRSQS